MTNGQSTFDNNESESEWKHLSDKLEDAKSLECGVKQLFAVKIVSLEALTVSQEFMYTKKAFNLALRSTTCSGTFLTWSSQRSRPMQCFETQMEAVFEGNIKLFEFFEFVICDKTNIDWKRCRS